MEKKKVQKNKPLPEPEEVRYNLHLGKLVNDAIETNTNYSRTKIGELINVGKQGMYHRVNNQSYGTCYQLIEISLLLKEDFITPMLRVIQNDGIHPPEMYTPDIVTKLQAEVQHFKELWERSKREIDLLHNTIETMKKT